MIPDSQESRAQEFQTPAQPDPVPFAPRTDAPHPSQIIDSPSHADLSSRGESVTDFNKKKHPVNEKKPSMVVENAPNGGKYLKLSDERSQFRRPEEIRKIERGTVERQEVRKLRHGTLFNHGGILVRRGGVVKEGGDDENFEAVGNGLRPSPKKEFDDSIKQTALRDELSKLMPYAFPQELVSLLWTLTGQSVKSGYVAKIVKEDAAGELRATWGEATGGSVLDCSFVCTKTGDNTVTVKKGRCYLGGSAGMQILETPVTCSSSGYIYIRLNLAGSPVWSGPTFSASDPDGLQGDDISIWTLCEVNVSNGVIDSVFQRWLGDIFESLV